MKKYVLPTHTIKIESSKQISFSSEKSFQVKIIAAYTFGEFIQGEAVVTFWKLRWDYNFLTRTSFQVRKAVFTKNVLIDSAEEVIDVSFANDLNMFYAETIVVTVKFTESFTKKVIEAEKTMDFNAKTYDLIYSGAESYGFDETINFKVSLRDIETGEPVRILSRV